MVNWKDWKTYLFLLIPMVTGYITSFSCTIGKDAGSKVPARPPSWVFGTVWPILYLFLGLSWVLLRQTNYHIIDILMTLNIVGLIAWIFVYGCKKNKKNALYIILIVLLIALQIFGLEPSTSLQKLQPEKVNLPIFADKLKLKTYNQFHS